MDKDANRPPSPPSTGAAGSGLFYTPKPILDYVLAESSKVEVKIIDYTQGTGAFLTSVVRQLREYDAIGVIIINPPFSAPNDGGERCGPAATEPGL